VILTGVAPWKKNMLLLLRIILGTSFLALPRQTWSLENGSSNTNFMLMVPWTDTRLARFFEALHNGDYDETFSPVVKPATVRTVLTLAHSQDCPIHQLDVKNAFLHGVLSETVYCSQPIDFTDSALPNHVCKLNKSLYGLKQAPCAWYSRFATYLATLGFSEARLDTSLFIYHRGADTVYLLLYVDDIILTASS
jgi:hypothetical protein